MVILFHGSFGNPEIYWLPYLKRNLEALGHEVIVPKFPVENWEEMTKKGPNVDYKNQNLNNWLSAFEPIFRSLKGDDKLYAVGHSMGCLFILHVVEHFHIRFEKAIFVSPFLEKLNTLWQVDKANKSFYRNNFDFRAIKKNILSTYVIYSDNDPYVKTQLALSFTHKIGAKQILVKGGGHFNEDYGFIEFPFLLDLCKTNFT